MLIVVGLLFAATKVTVHAVHRDDLNCGSVVKPVDVEAFGTSGTNPRPALMTVTLASQSPVSWLQVS
jgi:hypothetical protein